MSDDTKERLERAREMGSLTLGTMAKITEVFGEIADRDDLSDEEITKTLLIVGGMATGTAIGDDVLKSFITFARQKLTEGGNVPFEKASPETMGVGRDVFIEFRSLSGMIACAIMDGITLAAEAQIEVMQDANPDVTPISAEAKRHMAIKAAQSFMIAFKLTMKNFEIPDPEKTAQRVRELYEENGVSLSTN